MLNTSLERPSLTAAELIKHPEFLKVYWDLQPTKKGKVEVAKDRGGPVDIVYEVHGHGPKLMVVRIGCFSISERFLGGSSTAYSITNLCLTDFEFKLMTYFFTSGSWG